MVDEQEVPAEDSIPASHTAHHPDHGEAEKKKTSLYLALGLFLIIILGLGFGIWAAVQNSSVPAPVVTTPVASESAPEESGDPEVTPTEENSQGLSGETVEDLASSSTDGDGLIDFIEYNPADSTYTVIVRNTSAADETYGVTVLVEGEAVGAKGVEVPASSTVTTTVEVDLPRGTDEVNLRLDGERLGEGIVEVLHQN